MYPLATLLCFCYKIKLTIRVFLSLLLLYFSVYFSSLVTTNDSLSLDYLPFVYMFTIEAGNQTMTVYPFQHIKELNSSWTCIHIQLVLKTVEIYFETFHSIEISCVPEYLTLSRKSSHQWVILNDRYSIV